jgi:hypothetical protein
MQRRARGAPLVARERSRWMVSARAAVAVPSTPRRVAGGQAALVSLNEMPANEKRRAPELGARRSRYEPQGWTDRSTAPRV